MLFWFELLFEPLSDNVIVLRIWLGGDTEVGKFVDELAILLELACCWLVVPLIAACKIGVDDWRRLWLDEEDCGDVEPTDEADEEDDDEDDDVLELEATLLFVELLLLLVTVTSFVMISWFPSPVLTIFCEFELVEWLFIIFIKFGFEFWLVVAVIKLLFDCAVYGLISGDEACGWFNWFNVFVSRIVVVDDSSMLHDI